MPFTAHFQDKSIGNPDTWKWDLQFDGIVDDSIPDPSYTYQDPGFYSVELIAGNTAYTDTVVKVNYISVTSDVVKASSRLV